MGLAAGPAVKNEKGDRMTQQPQHHPTRTMTTPRGEQVEIDVLMVPVIEQLWRLGYDTLRSCQDGGESTLAGTTAARPDEIERFAAYNAGRAWVTVRDDEAPGLLAGVRELDPLVDWRPHPARTAGWCSITIPTDHLDRAAAVLRQLPIR